MNVPGDPVLHDVLIRSKLLKDSRLVHTELSIVRGLANRDKAKRMAQMRKLPRYFGARGRSQLPSKEGDFMLIWKGLLYTMWMADQPQVEEKLGKQLADMVDGFAGNTNCSLAYFGAFMLTMSEEFFGIDLWNIEKFPMLVRRMLRSILCLFKHSQWSVPLLNDFNISMQLSVFAERPNSRRLTQHYMSIFFEELAMVSDGEITAYKVSMFLRPFVTYIVTQHDDQLVAHCRTKVLHRLLQQSDLGRQETGNEMQLPVLPFNAECVLDGLYILTRTSSVNSKRLEILRELIQIFETYNGGVFPQLNEIASDAAKKDAKPKGSVRFPKQVKEDKQPKARMGSNPKKKQQTEVHPEHSNIKIGDQGKNTVAPTPAINSEPETVGVSNAETTKPSQKSTPRDQDAEKTSPEPNELFPKAVQKGEQLNAKKRGLARAKMGGPNPKKREQIKVMSEKQQEKAEDCGKSNSDTPKTKRGRML